MGRVRELEQGALRLRSVKRYMLVVGRMEAIS